MPTEPVFSVVIPAKNEEQGLQSILPRLWQFSPHEIIVVDDGSSDNTRSVAQAQGCKVISHPASLGNGAAVKAGAREVSDESSIIIFMDADGQHRPEDIPELLSQLRQGNQMVVGARSRKSQAGFMRGIGNRFYNWFASLIVGHKIEDLTSGFRAVNKDFFRQFLYLLPNGFSYPTTITMAFFRAGYSVSYIPIAMPQRIGSSHLNVIKDGIRFLLIIFKIGTLYSPLKIFMPIALLHFLLGSVYYVYTYVSVGTFTNMGALLITNGVIIFLIGLISEQITALMYRK